MRSSAGISNLGRGLPLAVSLGILVAVAALPAAAEIRSAELRVNGLTCPFCAFGIEKKLRKVDGVREVEVLLDEGRIRLAFSSQNAATVQDLEAAVGEAGFELAGLRLIARGRLIQDGDGQTFEVGPKTRFRLVEPKDGAPRSISPEILHRLREAADDGVVVIGGEVHDRKSDLPALSVERIESTRPEST